MNRSMRPHQTFPCLLLVACATPVVQGPVHVAEDSRQWTSLRDQAELRDAWTKERFETVLPRLMREERVDMWTLIAREYNEDPVLATMLPAEWRSARRTTMLVLAAGERGVERLAVSRYPVGEFFESVWNPDEEPDQWKRLGELVAQKRPRSLALNVSHDSAHADGLTSSLHMNTLKALPPRYEHAVNLRHALPVRWLETRTAGEQEAYPGIVERAHDLILEGLGWITPGETRTEDLAWWYEERIQSRGLATWFHPMVSVQRADGHDRGTSFAEEEGDRTILSGDLIHLDVGIVWAGLHTDTQHQAYVLRPGETEAPAGLREGYRLGNRAQDLLMERFRVGATGNDVLVATREALAAEGIDGRVYTHPLGLHGHGAGPLIGLWDQQSGVPGRGNLPVHADTAWAIELGVSHVVPEWGGQTVEFLLEEDALFDGETVRFLDGRLVEPTLVGAAGGLVRSGLDR